jgi:hypothetical protein
MPACLPAVLMSWQGKPPQIMSADPGAGLNVQMSLWIGTSGQCLRRIFWQNGSRSTNWTVSIPPTQRAASEKPPMPLKVSIIRKVIADPGVTGLAARSSPATVDGAASTARHNNPATSVHHQSQPVAMSAT